MRNYQIIDDYVLFNHGFPANLQILDNESGLYYLIWKDDTITICFDRNPSSPKNTGYTKILKEAFVFEFDDTMWYK